MEEEIKTEVVQIPNRTGVMLRTYLNTDMMSFQHYSFIDKLNEKLAEKAVKEIWKKHGANIMKKVDKKTIGNLTVKKLTTLIAKELKV